MVPKLTLGVPHSRHLSILNSLYLSVTLCFLQHRKSSNDQINYLVSSLIADLNSVSIIKSYAKRNILSRCFFMYSRNFCVTIFELFTMSNFGSSLFLFSFNFNCMTKLCSVFKRNVKLFLNFDLGHADLDEQRKLLTRKKSLPPALNKFFLNIYSWLDSKKYQYHHQKVSIQLIIVSVHLILKLLHHINFKLNKYEVKIIFIQKYIRLTARALNCEWLKRLCFENSIQLGINQ